MRNPHPFLFDEFFASGKEESISPFLTPTSRVWGKNLLLKSASLSAVILALSFIISFFHTAAAYALLIPVYFLVGTPALIATIEDLKNLEINIDVLMTLAALLSVLIGSGMEGALLLVLFELSASMENAVMQKTKSSLVSLHQLSPKTASVLAEDGTLFERSVKEVTIGTLLLIKAGETVPLDGEVVEGSSFVNLVHLTGESRPLSKTLSDEVPAGARNLDGTLTLRVTRTSSDSTLSRIIALITSAQEAKPRLERLFERFGKWYASIIILLSLFFALTLPLFLSIAYLGVGGGIYRALTFLIAASPCALIIATPTAYLSAISSCARRGILLKGGSILDALFSCHTIAFDKTGTLTTGRLSCTQIVPLSHPSPHDLDKALSIAASLERHSSHPVAEAICSLAKSKGLPILPVEGFRAVPGYGVEGRVSIDGSSLPVSIGHSQYIATKLPKELPLPPEETLLLIGNALFSFHFIDTVRPFIKETLERLKKSKKFRLLILTGDHLKNTVPVAESVGISEIFADLRPEDKLKQVELLSQKGGLIMVGDGINDAPALARATVGISLGTIGSATAVDASDIVFLKDDLTLLDWLIHKASHTHQILKENIALALIVILFASIPALLGFIPLWMAVVLHEGGTVIVGLNSLRLLKT
jgi:Zn2+/Cd2+-exporting ATPase